MTWRELLERLQEMNIPPNAEIWSVEFDYLLDTVEVGAVAPINQHPKED